MKNPSRMISLLYPMARIPLCSWIFWVGGCALIGSSAAWHWTISIVCALLWIYLVPPLIARFFHRARPFGVLSHLSADYLHWQRLNTLQTLFNRFGCLEEGLRLLPGVYSAWLRLWGSQIGCKVQWHPGVKVTDRYLLEIGDNVIMETGCLLHSHTRLPDQRLIVDTIRLQTACIIGPHATIGPGCHIYTREFLPAGHSLPPFTVLKQQRAMCLVKTTDKWKPQG